MSAKTAEAKAKRAAYQRHRYATDEAFRQRMRKAVRQSYRKYAANPVATERDHPCVVCGTRVPKSRRRKLLDRVACAGECRDRLRRGEARCERCGRTFVFDRLARPANRRFCSLACWSVRWEWAACRRCGSLFARRATESYAHCSVACNEATRLERLRAGRISQRTARQLTTGAVVSAEVLALATFITSKGAE